MERELWQALYLLASGLDKRWGRWKYSTAEIVAVYFWAVLHDRPTSWAAEPAEWPADLRPDPLPPQSTLSRRLKQADSVELMTAVEQQLVLLIGLGQHWIHILDGKPLAVSPISHDRDAAWGRGARGLQKGYKLHAVWNGGPLFTTWSLAPMNSSEKTVARRPAGIDAGRRLSAGRLGSTTPITCTTTPPQPGSNSWPRKRLAAGGVAWAIAATAPADCAPLNC